MKAKIFKIMANPCKFKLLLMGFFRSAGIVSSCSGSPAALSLKDLGQ